MQKRIVMGLLAAAVNLQGTEANPSGETAGGEIRTVYVNQNNAEAPDTHATAIGGMLKYEAAPWERLRLGIGAYVSQKIGWASAEGDALNPGLASTGGGSYAYLGEAYVDYDIRDAGFRAGRFQIDTPFADTDDIRMHPNTFEGAHLHYRIGETTLSGAYLARWSGYDSGGDIAQFKPFAEGGSGVVLAGFTSESIANLAVQGWYAAADNVADFYYADTAYTIAYEDQATVEVSAQFAAMREKKDATGIESNIDGNVYGIAAVANFGRATVGAAYNRSCNGDGKFSANGFGGGPYVTSMEEMTIGGIEDVRSYRLSGELEMGGAGIEGLRVSLQHGAFKSTSADIDIRETDVVAAYALTGHLGVDMSYARIDDAGEGSGYSRFLARLSYNF